MFPNIKRKDILVVNGATFSAEEAKDSHQQTTCSAYFNSLNGPNHRKLLFSLQIKKTGNKSRSEQTVYRCCLRTLNP
jgi:hypothetical protein